MTLLDPQPPPPPNPWPKRILVALMLVLAVGSVLYWQFRYYGEEKQVEQFMDALVAGDYPRAYQLWKPSPSYRYQDFLEDWGELSTWGRIHSYEIVGVEGSKSYMLRVPVPGGTRARTIELSGQSSGLVISVRINRRLQPERIWVERKDKSLSFPPF